MTRAREVAGACLLAVVGALVGVRILYRQIDAGTTFPAGPPVSRVCGSCRDRVPGEPGSAPEA